MAKKEKLSYEDFYKRAILKLRNVSKSSGIHCVFSGFNQAFREYYGEDPVKITQELASKGKIEIRPVKRGVMIYLPGDSPTSRDELGSKALSKILNEPAEHEQALLEKVLSEITPEGAKKFPEDFLRGWAEDEKMHELALPGTRLELDPNSETIVTSPKRHFRYKAKNPPEAKYIIYTHKIGQMKIKIPKDNRIVFKAVASYEKYCKEVKHICFTSFLGHTNDEEMAELLTKQAEQKLDLRAKSKD